MIKTMPRTLGVTIAVLVACASLGSSSAQERAAGSDRMAKRFDRMDRDGDGVVTQEDVERLLGKSFKRADRNDDGVIDQAEIKMMSERASRRNSGRGAKMAKRFERADVDRDGKVTRSEFLESRPRWMTRADRDRDGSVTRAEFDAFFARRMQRRAGKAD